MGIYIIFGIFTLISWAISNTLKNRLKEYSQYPTLNNLTGKEIAERMLADNGIRDVKVISTNGQLTDHYNPIEKTVNLSHDVYNGQNISAAAIAAHECGHAVQHAKAYAWLQFRSRIVPFVSITSRYIQWVLLIGVLTLNIFPALLGLGILLFAVMTLFSFITLPVEFDATRRGLDWLNHTRIVNGEYMPKATSALNWAAMTYVVAALSSLATLMYYVMIYSGRRSNN